jgi:MYXO-CTERM domain-containing protein
MKPNLNIPRNDKPKPSLLWLMAMAVVAFFAARAERRR